MQPKRLYNLSQYEESAESERNTSFQSLTKYTPFTHSSETITNRVKTDVAISEEGIYEVLDGDEESKKAKLTSSGTKRSVVISGEHSENYNKLHFEDY